MSALEDPCRLIYIKHLIQEFPEFWPVCTHGSATYGSGCSRR